MAVTSNEYTIKTVPFLFYSARAKSGLQYWFRLGDDEGFGDNDIRTLLRIGVSIVLFRNKETALEYTEECKKNHWRIPL